MGGHNRHSHAFILCAEDDDFALIALAEVARSAEISLEVLPGVESGNDELLHALVRNPRDLFVLVESIHLRSPRCEAIESMFADVRQPEQILVRVTLDVRDPLPTLNAITRNLRRVGESPAPAPECAGRPFPVDDDDGITMGRLTVVPRLLQ